MTTTHPPVVIQGGMGIAVSSWRLAREVSLTGQLGDVLQESAQAALRYVHRDNMVAEGYGEFLNQVEEV